MDLRSEKLRRPLLFVLSALLLALVILSIAAISSPRKTTERAEESALVSAQKLAEQAEDAASKNQTGTALSLALRALEEDPDNPTALRVKRAMSSPQSAGSDAPADPADREAPDGAVSPDTYSLPMDELWVLLPTGFKGWSRGEIVSSDSMALVTFEPTTGDAASDTVVRAVVYARDAGTSAKAAETVRRVYKRAYPDDASSPTIGKVTAAHFGTDGTQLAAVGMARGRYSFEVIVTAVPGFDPKGLRSIAIELASALPAAK